MNLCWVLIGPWGDVDARGPWARDEAIQKAKDYAAKNPGTRVRVVEEIHEEFVRQPESTDVVGASCTCGENPHLPECGNKPRRRKGGAR